MASPNNPKSVETLIRQHSQARVIYKSEKTWVTGFDALGKPQFSRPLHDSDVINGMVRKYAR